MSLLELTEEEFNKKILEFMKMSEELNDNWRLNEKDSKFFLSKKQKISLKSDREAEGDDIDTTSDVDPSLELGNNQVDLIAVEYHVLFHPSYQVPVLYFNAYSDSALIGLNDLSKIFAHEFESQLNLQNSITQAEHPILFRPFFMLHPCKVNEVLSKFKESKNFVLTFLTLFGPHVRLKINPNYQKFFEIPAT